MLKVKVQILTYEYSVNIFIGKSEELKEAILKYAHQPKDIIKERVENCRGTTWNCLINGSYPLIAINSELETKDFLGTLAHEASHAMDFISEYVNIDDRSGEWKAHGIGAIVRKVCGNYLKTNPKKHV